MGACGPDTKKARVTGAAATQGNRSPSASNQRCRRRCLQPFPPGATRRMVRTLRMLVQGKVLKFEGNESSDHARQFFSFRCRGIFPFRQFGPLGVVIHFACPETVHSSAQQLGQLKQLHSVDVNCAAVAVGGCALAYSRLLKRSGCGKVLRS